MSTLRVTDLQQIDGTPFQFAPRSITTFTASGTWTKPVWCKSILVRVCGGGGGGGGYSESGGAGGYTELTILNPPSSVPVGVGGGAIAAIYSATPNGLYGGTSSFGTYCYATGGGNAGCIVGHVGGGGGMGYGGNINIKGGSGHGHLNQGHSGGVGGASYFGGGLALGHNRGTDYAGGAAPGSGGAGSNVSTGIGGMGGIVIVEEYN